MTYDLQGSLQQASEIERLTKEVKDLKSRKLEILRERNEAWAKIEDREMFSWHNSRETNELKESVDSRDRLIKSFRLQVKELKKERDEALDRVKTLKSLSISNIQSSTPKLKDGSEMGYFNYRLELVEDDMRKLSARRWWNFKR